MSDTLSTSLEQISLRPTLLALPPEIRSSILDHVFSSRTIGFFASDFPHPVLETATNKIYHEWRQGFLRANRQMHDEGRVALRRAIAESTVILDGVVGPKSFLDKNRLDRHLYTRSMLRLFIKQHGDDVRMVKIFRDRIVILEMGCFRNLKRVLLVQDISDAFEVDVPDTDRPSRVKKVSFSMFEEGASHDEVKVAIVQHWLDQDMAGRLSSFLSGQLDGDARSKAFKSIISQGREERGFEVCIVVRVLSQSSFWPGVPQMEKMEVVVDADTKEVVSFRRP